MSRKSVAKVLGAVALAAGMMAAGEARADEITLGTLAPADSMWGKVFNVWAKKLKEKTKGSLTLKIYANGQQGDEDAMVAKMKAGQLDAAACTSVGMSKIYKPILALQLPGLAPDWTTLDRVRNSMMTEFQTEVKKNGFEIVGWGDVGLARTYSNGFKIGSPGDMANSKVKIYAWESDPIAPVIARVFGFTPKKTTVPALLSELERGSINTATVPALAATSLQWSRKFTTVSETPAAAAVGGIVISQRKLQRLSAANAAAFRATAKTAGDILLKSVRDADRLAFEDHKKRMSHYQPDAKAFEVKFKEVRRQAGQGVFPAALVTRLERLAGK